MKKLLLVLVVLVTSCVHVGTVPVGKRCSSDLDCNEDRGEYCGFTREGMLPTCKR
jgi:hypothetical protein